MARFVRFLILVSFCTLLTNLAFGDELADGTVNRDENPSPTITISEAEELINLLPATKELRGKGIDVKWDVQAVPTMNDQDYYFLGFTMRPRRKSAISVRLALGTMR